MCPTHSTCPLLFVTASHQAELANATPLRCPSLTLHIQPHAALQHRRDLAEQTHNNFTAFRKFLADPALRNELFVGGTNPQVRRLCGVCKDMPAKSLPRC